MAVQHTRILVVEDEPAHAEAIRRSLEEAEGAELLILRSLQEFREQWSTWSPDIALIDLNLPDGRATEVLADSTTSQAFPVIVMTSYGSEQTAVEALKSGALDYLVKSPEAFLSLPRTLERWLREWQLLQDGRRMQQELREGEELFQSILETTQDGFLVSDPQGRLLQVNEAYCRMSGYGLAELLAMSISELDAEKSPLEIDDHIRAIAHKGIDRFETRHRRKDGSTYDVEVTVQCKPERTKSMISFIRDITARKQAEKTIRHFNHTLEQRVLERTTQLEAANQEMEAFSYSVSHDLRAPLRGIDGFSQALVEDYQDRLDETGRNYISRIRAGTHRMGQLIDDLLKLSRVCRSEPIRVQTDLSDLCRKVVDELAQSAPERRIEVSIQPGLSAWVDRNLLQVSLENLLRNAWKFTSKSENPRIEVGETTSPSGEPAFFIRDNGAGFDMEHRGKLFNAFQRLHSTNEFEGTGIGLAIVKRIIHRHGGRIWAEAEPGKGAAFFFTLPDRRAA